MRTNGKCNSSHAPSTGLCGILLSVRTQYFGRTRIRKKYQHYIDVLGGVLPNLWQPTDRQLADTTTQRWHFFTDNQLADTTTGRHDKSQTIFLKTHRHSPTETFLGKGWKEIFFSMSILLYFRNEHITTLLSVNTNTCTYVDRQQGRVRKQTN